MPDSKPSVERLAPRRGRGLPPVAAATAAIVVIAFLVGFALGGRVTPVSSQNPSPPPAVAGPSVSTELRNAFINVEGGQGWELCGISAVVLCQPAFTVPNLEFADFGALPLTVSATDWGLITPLAILPGHYVIAGPMALVAPQVTLAKVGPSGAGTLIGTSLQTVLNGVIWADVGTLEPGRYVEVVRAYELQAGSTGQISATPIGWALGFDVGP
jgi:hypothetical protein